MPILGPPKPALDPRHRRVPEREMLAILAFEGWALEMATGREAEGEAGAARALALALGFGAGFALDGRGGRLFDPAEVDQALAVAALDPRDSFWRDRKRIANLAVADFDQAPGKERAEGAAPAVRFEVALRRRFDLSRFAGDAPLRLRLPLPLAGAYHADISVRPVVPARLGAETVLADGRLELRLAAPRDRDLEIGADLAFTAHIPGGAPARQTLDPREAERCLRPREGPIDVSPRVRALAQSLAGDLPPIAAVAAFWRHLAQNFSFCWLRYDEIPPDAAGDWILEHGVFDCVHAAGLLAALCRARGIPARRVTGHTLYRLAPTNHNWVEIWLAGQGWTPLDIYHPERTRPLYAPSEGWPEHFARRRDYRLAFERLPEAFTGPMSVRFPRAWQMVHAPIDHGVAVSYVDIADGRLIYRDEIRILRREPLEATRP